MAEGFAFEIVGDASKANRAVDGVVERLGKIPSAAKRVTGELGNAFGHAETIVRKYNQALSEGAPLKYTQALTKAADAARAHVLQLQREQQMLQQIHGPAQQVAQDIQTLNSLLAKGAINAGEFNQKLGQIRPPAAISRGGGGFDLGSIAGGLPGGSLIAGAVGGGVGGAATAGAQLAVQGAGQVIEMADSYASLQQRLKALTGSGEEARAMYDRLFVSANKTRTDIDISVESYLRIARAMKGMGVTAEQALQFNERLSESFALSGAKGASAAAGAMQLSQALASGVLRGDEFNSIMENTPVVAEIIAQHLHVTTGALRQMAEDGKISAQVIYDSFSAAGAGIDRDFAQTIPTVSQQVTVLKNEVKKMVGEMAQNAGLSQATASAIKSFGEIAQKAGEQTKFWADQLDRIGVKPGDLTGGGWEGMSKLNDMSFDVFKFDFFDKGTARMNDAQQVINRTIAEGTGKLNEYSQAMVEQTLRTQFGADAAKTFAEAVYLATNATDPWADAQYKSATALDYVTIALRAGHDVLDKLNQKHKEHHHTLTDLEKLYQSIHGPTEQAYKDLANLEVLYARGSVSLGVYNQELAKRNDLLAAARLSELEGMGGVHSMPTAGLGQRAGGMDVVPGVPEAPASATMSKQQAESLTRMWHEQLGKIETDNQRTAGMIVDVWKPVENALVSAITSGKFAWDDFAKSMESSLANIAVKLLEAAALTALLGPGGGSGSFGQALYKGVIGGGKNGFDYTVGSSGLQLPGFQSGGSITRQAGGPEPLLAMWWMQPNETLSIRTEEQQRRAQQGAGSGGSVTVTPTVKVLMPRDRRSIVDDSRDGMTTLVRLQERVKRGR